MDVMKRLGILVGGAVVMVPAHAAPNAYLTRVGPKPLRFDAPPPPRDEVLRMLPPLDSGLPPKQVANPITTILPTDSSNLFPVPAETSALGMVDPLGLPENWVESLLGPPRVIPGMDSGGAAGDSGSTDGSWGRGSSSLTPEDLVPFFVSPASEGNTQFVIPVPFIPGPPSNPANPSPSSRATFRQE
jgi:hypothetical protein